MRLLLAAALLQLTACRESTLQPAGDPAAVGDARTSGDPGPGDEVGDPPLPDRPLAGIYDVTGSDAVWGDYTGSAEIRTQGDGSVSVIHLQTWTTADFEGESIALAWTGALESATVSVELEPVGFITAYDDQSRAAVDPTPIRFTSALTRQSYDTLTTSFRSTRPGAEGFDEVWTWRSSSGADPIWRNRREVFASHAPVPEATRLSLFVTYATFHELPEVAPYVDDPRFQEAMHYLVRDPTDREFYRANPNTLRVIQRVVDPISLVEARLRNRAFRHTAAEKAALFDADMALYGLNEANVFSTYYPSTTAFQPSYDSTLWTGVYAASQALRFMETNDPVAWANMTRALDGLFLCFDIAPTLGDFARAVRPYDSEANQYVRGLPPYEQWEWRPGANNDMFKGFVVAFAWAWLAIEHAGGDATLESRIQEIVEQLRDHSPIGGDGSTNEMLLHMLHWMMTDDLGSWLDYQTIFLVVRPFYIDQGNGCFYEYGTSDWSGNHLIIQGLLTGWLVADQQQDTNKPAFEDGLRNALLNMRDTRLGLFQMIAGNLGDFVTEPPEVADAISVLEEFPYPKFRVDIDWRIHPSFVMSPFPNLPWKNDWTATDRKDGIHSYPFFEREITQFAWKDRNFRFTGASSEAVVGGADYLFAYWFARWRDLVD